MVLLLHNCPPKNISYLLRNGQWKLFFERNSQWKLSPGSPLDLLTILKSSLKIRHTYLWGISWRHIRQMAPLVAWSTRRSRQDHLLTSCLFLKVVLKIRQYIYGALAEDIAVRWLHLFFDLVCSSSPINGGCYVTPNPTLPLFKNKTHGFGQY